MYIVQFVRQDGPTAEAYKGPESMVVHDTTKQTLRLHDGVTAGGHALAREDLANVPQSAFSGVLQSAANHADTAAATAASQAEANAVTSANQYTDTKLVDYRLKSTLIGTADVADGAITQDKIDPAVELGGPSLGAGSIIRTNDPVLCEDLTVTAGVNGMSAGPITVGNTNELLWSEDLTNAVWPDVIGHSTVANVNTLNPFGDAQLISEVTLTGANPLFRQSLTNDLAGQRCTFSGWFKRVSGNVSAITADIFDGETVQLGVPTAEWVRLSGSFLSNTPSSFLDLQIYGDTGTIVQVFGLQLTVSSKPVTYVKTTDTVTEATLTVEGTYTVVGD